MEKRYLVSYCITRDPRQVNFWAEEMTTSVTAVTVGLAWKPFCQMTALSPTGAVAKTRRLMKDTAARHGATYAEACRRLSARW